MSDVIDLDALVPVDVTIKFGEQEIKVSPPKMVDVLKLGAMAQKLQSPGDIADSDLAKTVDGITEIVIKCVPELAGKDINTAQLLKLVEIISKMAMPPDAKELSSRGITADSPKALSA